MEEIYNVIKVKQELEQKTKKSANCNQTDDKKYLFQTKKKSNFYLSIIIANFYCQFNEFLIVS
jgi:hypothetical protein